jgi:5-methylcytosine-specific restriction protein B
MNTADRSIALVDAALRRRFHFVPFFPDRGPMKGLLDRWLGAHHEPGWVGELVAMVNDELSEALGGPHLQLGPSYFMRSALDEQSLGRVWRCNIEPVVEDQFFGDPAQIEYFGFDRVLRRYRSSVDWSEDAPLGAVSPAEPAATVERDPDRAGETGSEG